MKALSGRRRVDGVSVVRAGRANGDALGVGKTRVLRRRRQGIDGVFPRQMVWVLGRGVAQWDGSLRWARQERA